MPASAPLSGKDAITPSDLTGETLIAYGPQTTAGRMLMRAFQEAGQVYDPQIEFNLSIAAASLVTAGLGIALVDGLIPWARFGDLVARPFRPASALDIVLSSGTAMPQTRFAREFARDLQAAIHDLESGALANEAAARPPAALSP